MKCAYCGGAMTYLKLKILITIDVIRNKRIMYRR